MKEKEQTEICITVDNVQIDINTQFRNRIASDSNTSLFVAGIRGLLSAADADFLVNEVVQLKLPKQSDALNGEVSLDDQAGNQRHTADNSPLIPSTGQDSSISSLVHSLWSDYGAITSLNHEESFAVRTELLVFGKEILSIFGEIVILAGGCDSRGNLLRAVELYNSETGTCKILPSMKKRCKMCSEIVFQELQPAVIGAHLLAEQQTLIQ
ncbi:hypothetical protein KY284_000622 [Solanum tuberosum]|nr:hypothetical protein KY284_000622 [Solanum tuberosum]